MKFIHPENQKILWKKINRTVVFQECPVSLEEKQHWFKQIIQLFFNEYKYIPIDLKELNRKTILHMINDLTQQNRMYKSNSFQSINETFTPMNMYEGSKKSIEKENTSGFEERKKEYEFMMKPSIPDKINFTEKVEDDVITNMDELVRKHKEQREADFSMTTTETIILNLSESSIPQNEEKKENEKEEGKKLDSHFLPIKQDKHIQWSNELEENKYIDTTSNKLISPPLSPNSFESNFLKKEMKNMDDEITKLKETVQTLSEEVRILKETNTLSFYSDPLFQMTDS